MLSWMARDAKNGVGVTLELLNDGPVLKMPEIHALILATAHHKRCSRVGRAECRENAKTPICVALVSFHAPRRIRYVP